MDNLVLSVMQIIGISGGTSLIIVILAGKLWEIWFNRIKEGQKAEFETQIQNLKFEKEKLNYISKAQFDAEFKMYQELSEACFEMVLSSTALFPNYIDYLPESEEEQKEIFNKRYKDAVDKLVLYQNLLFKYAPFISKELYEKFEDLRKMVQAQTNWYPDFKLGRIDNTEILRELKDERHNCIKRTPIIEQKHKEIIEALRIYLNNIKVL